MVPENSAVVRYDCDGNTNQYSFLFPIVDSGDLKVRIYDKATQYEAVLSEGTHYAVAAAVGGFENGGTVSIHVWDSDAGEYVPYDLADTVRITLERAPDPINTSEYKNNEVLPKDQLENDVDRIYYHIQYLYEKFKHILYSSPSDPTEMQLPPAETRANHVLAFDSDGKPVAGETIVTPVSDYMEQFLQATVWDDLVADGFFDKVITYEKVKNGFDSVEDGYTRDPSGFTPSLSMVNNLNYVGLLWTDLKLLTSLDSYEVERSELNASDGFTQVGAVPPGVTIFNDTPGYDNSGESPAAKTYWYRVRGKTSYDTLTNYSNTIEVTVYPVGPADIEANAITAVHIQTGSITTDLLAADAINADMISVNELINTTYTHIDGGSPEDALGEEYDGGEPDSVYDSEIDWHFDDYTGAYAPVPVNSLLFLNSIYSVPGVIAGEFRGVGGRVFLNLLDLPTSDPVEEGRIFRSGTQLHISLG